MPLYDEIEFEDMTYDEETMVYSYPCPCGDRFKVTLEDLWDGEDVADCQSCTLYIQVIYDEEDLPPLPEDDDDESDSEEESVNLSAKKKDVEDNDSDDKVRGENNFDDECVRQAVKDLSISSSPLSGIVIS